MDMHVILGKYNHGQVWVARKNKPTWFSYAPSSYHLSASAGGGGGYECHVLTSASSLLCHGTAGLFHSIPKPVGGNFTFTCQDLSRAFGRVFTIKCPRIYPGFANRKVCIPAWIHRPSAAAFKFINVWYITKCWKSMNRIKTVLPKTAKWNFSQILFG